MHKPLLHTMIFISGIFFFFGIGICGLVSLSDNTQMTAGGYWHVFSLDIAHADDDEDEDDDWKWNERREDEREEKYQQPAPEVIAPAPLTPTVTAKSSPITIRAVAPKPVETVIMSSLIEPYRPLNGYTYVIYRLPDTSYIVADPDGRFIDHKYTTVEAAKRSIDEDGVYNPLIAYTAPNGQTYTILENIATHTYAYREDDGRTVQTAYTSKSDLITNLISENPYNPNAPYDTALENTISSDDIAYAQAIALGESDIQQIVSAQAGHAISIERPIVPADYQISIAAISERRVVTSTAPTNTAAAKPVARTAQTQTTKIATPVTVSKPVATTPKPVVVAPKPTAPAPAPVVAQPKVNTTTRAS